ncbi:hypothetical protein [Streptomyces sp. SID11385]|uniref:hypothetical protein n=1 Tax=Streptomyces sp. SID11385 TaxID=2706031 RepID=UPI0013CBC310|nr:hypothetical protein [Streptomyces sp. SID11385]NEA42343.1 hypothetical protein [Streptomyces sp. SID11385]
MPDSSPRHESAAPSPVAFTPPGGIVWPELTGSPLLWSEAHRVRLGLVRQTFGVARAEGWAPRVIPYATGREGRPDGELLVLAEHAFALGWLCGAARWDEGGPLGRRVGWGEVTTALRRGEAHAVLTYDERALSTQAVVYRDWVRMATDRLWLLLHVRPLFTLRRAAPATGSPACAFEGGRP